MRVGRREPVYGGSMDPQAATILASAALGGIAGAAVSGGLTWWVARGQRDHERSQAREARRQARWERTYVDVMEYVFLVGDFVERTEAFITFEAAPGPPPFPDDAALRSLNARTVVFGSQAMQQQLIAFSKLAREFQADVWHLGFERTSGASGGGDLLKLRTAVDDKRKEIRNAIEEISRLANTELDAGRG